MELRDVELAAGDLVASNARGDQAGRRARALRADRDRKGDVLRRHERSHRHEDSLGPSCATRRSREVTRLDDAEGVTDRLALGQRVQCRHLAHGLIARHWSNAFVRRTRYGLNRGHAKDGALRASICKDNGVVDRAGGAVGAAVRHFDLGRYARLERSARGGSGA